MIKKRTDILHVIYVTTSLFKIKNAQNAIEYEYLNNQLIYTSQGSLHYASTVSNLLESTLR